MKTKNIFKTLAMALLMPAMLLTTACSNSDDDDVINNNENIVNNTEQTAQKGYPLQVTVNVTREGDEATTRASYNESTKKLSFSAGDKLYVMGTETTAGQFSGTLDMVSAGTFSGTITTKNPYSGTAHALFTAATDVRAALLPAGYGTPGYFSIVKYNGYDDDLILDKNKAFATSKAAAVEQFSDEYALEYSDGFTLSPYNAILYFNISGLSASTSVDVALTGPSSLNITGSVTTNGSGEATFAVGVDGGTDFNNLSLTVGGNDIALASGSKTLTAGKIYNVNRAVGALAGKFSVSSTKQVYFSKGNLRYASGTWSFFDNQYDYYTSYSADAWDKFGWSTSATTYGMNTSTSKDDYSGDFVDWGATMGTGWFTLTSDEWTYLFNDRSASTVGGTADGRYAKAKVNNVQGVILFPDTYTHPDGVTAPTGVNAIGNTGWNDNSYNVADWTKMESAGCVFLPAAGYRNGSTVGVLGASGFYWSATPNVTDRAYRVYFLSSNLFPANYNYRYCGYSVRLVR